MKNAGLSWPLQPLPLAGKAVAGGVLLRRGGTTTKAEICTDMRGFEEVLTFGVRKHKQESSEGSRYQFWVAVAVEQASS